ncbi:cobalamin-5'-phosphate synthase [Tenacibaculum mesophilum]|uniref:Adenosylcobinamide-GDP ribazoletransferase n=1 Tax=Tenacibaculum mesophilum TaxID=104268 RepID=A0ABM7CCW8_9FLAO|nr:adenosylcobinamide-GDP ribazoletransferase [Tenacibaculum mesophilum]AZJ31588.1 adenosylcobinamide-GDP ribazoletransferase [Tenacibaculum mesophilum]QFS29636.1 adenosylcobinamide-GDP ribazoletransferase [Tenacibaculum mesophilum]SHG00541.1 cobalamin-5'-phosphate synthase [Tenacibaculum mesophilum]
MIKRQIHYFLTAVLFFTRIPCPKWVDHSPEILNKSSRYFSLVGIVVGSIAALAYFAFSYIFPTDIAIVISMISSIWITGAFHEDGFADVCDGFGGGWTKEKILTIMKDSRLGTFGVSGLVFILAIKFLALYHLQNLSIDLILVIISGHSISRFIATVLLYTHDYVRDIDSSKIKPTTKQMSSKSLLISAIFGVVPLFFFQNPMVFLVLLPLLLTYLYMGHFFKKWIGGQTGDCAGALQQVAEIVFYLSLLVLWKLF